MADDVPCCEPMFWGYLVACVVLVAFAGLMSGLTLGLMSLSLVDLEVLIKAGQPDDRRNAAKILPIVKRQHLLLCTLLIGNAMAMEALPIFLDSILPPWAAVLISVTLILAFGEIIPQAICSRYGLRVGAKLSPIVKVIVIILFPVAYPISKLLDWVLGKKHSALLRRAELKTLVDLLGNKAGKGGELTHDETTIITGALDMTLKKAKDAMTPISKIFSLDINSKLDEKTMEVIIGQGHSRVPIYMCNLENIVGLILVKNLIKCNPEDGTPIRDLTIRKIPRVNDQLPLYDILNLFQKGHSHMAVVVKNKDDTNRTNAENTRTEREVVEINIDPNSERIEAERKGTGIHPQLSWTERMLMSAPSYSSEKEFLEFQERTLSSEELETISFPSEEEVIGIITLEDVIEELLQEEILDETDGYMEVHNRIKINMLPSQRSPMRSPGTPSASQFQRRYSPSPLSPYHRSPLSMHSVLRSPIPPYVRSPVMKPSISNSPGKSIPTSPAAVTGSPDRRSPSSHRVSRKPYEKLRKPDDVCDSL
ncbi:unnamed protein product [Linum tenue]|uniref:CNNM transmembrane domain-containing protein n=1 Tax=Linum tenue TaxID=586396 RepID=A0AAV0QNJ4_9ROSI|nr:unnamed protein product [Linum tenue]